MPTEIKDSTYSAVQTLTNAIASLASDTNLLAGYESDAIDNTTEEAGDIILSVKVTTGTSPTASRQIQIWAVAWNGSGWPDVFDGTTGAETISAAEVKTNLCQLVCSLATNATSDKTYESNGISLRQVFRGCLPSKMVLFVTHNTGVNLNATAGNHSFTYQYIKPEIQ